MAKFSFISILSKVWDFICVIFQCIGYLICTLFIGIIFAFCILLCYNWFIFPFWALIRPKSVAKDMTEDREKNDCLWTSFFRFVTPLLAWEIRLLPWYAKKYFISKMPEIFSPVTMVKYYRKAANKEEAAKLMNPEAKLYAWHKLNDVERADFLSFISGWNDDMLEYAIECDLDTKIKKYYENNTPSENHMLLMLTAADAKGKFWFKPILTSCIKKHGLKQSLIDDIFRDSSAELKSLISQALEVYAQVSFVKAHHNINSSSIDWGMFCARTKDICPEAEMEMIGWMTYAFYREGHRMSEQAICHFCKLAYENSIYEGIAHTIFAEQGNDCRKSERAMALINSRSNLKELFILTSN